MFTIKKTIIIILVLITLQLSGCSRGPDDKETNALIKQNKALKQKVIILEKILSEKGIGPGRLLNEAKFFNDMGDNTKAKSFLNLLFMQYPDSQEAQMGRDLMFEQDGFDTYSLDLNVENASYFNSRKINRFPGSYIGLQLGAGGEGTSGGLELAHIWRNQIFGIGGSWMLTNDVDKTYYVSGSSSPTSDNLGYNNKGDELEIYGLWGKHIWKQIFFACSVGYSKQELVHLERTTATGAIYSTDTKTENYVTFSSQLRYKMKNENFLIMGYHNRRGFIAGINLKL